MNEPATGREIASRVPSAPPVLKHITIGPEDVARAFLEGRNQHTRAAYDRDLRDFAAFLGAEGPRAAVAALILAGKGTAHAMALSFRVHLIERGLAPATVARKLAALRSVVKLAGQVGQVDWDLSIASPTVEGYRDTSGPGEDGWKLIRERARADAAEGTIKGARDWAIVRLLHDLALRREEVASLDWEHLERDGAGLPRHVWILGKKRTQRERLSLPKATGEALLGWIERRGEHEGPLFPRVDRGGRGALSERISGRSIHRMIQALGERAGSRGLSPHKIRHHSITKALDRTAGDVRKVQRFSRHKDLRTLTIYDDRRRDGAGEVSSLVAEDE